MLPEGFPFHQFVLLPSDARKGIDIRLSTFSDNCLVYTVPVSASVRPGTLSRWHGTIREENRVIFQATLRITSGLGQTFIAVRPG